MENSKLRTYITKIEEFTQAGDQKQAIPLIQKLRNTKNLPRWSIAKIAELARRNGLYLLSLRLIRPLIYPKKLLEQKATAIESTVYASVLVFLGATNEAKKLLESIDVIEEPKALLFLSIAYIHEWEYEKPVHLLKQYLSMTSLTPYEKLVGSVNLLNSYVVLDNIKKATPLFEKIIRVAKKSGYHLLMGYAYELYAQLAIHRGDLEEAEDYLKQAEKNLGKTDSIYTYIVKKWQMYIDLQKTRIPLSYSQKKLLIKLKTDCIKRRFWEVARDYELLESISSQNSELFRRVYFGTPFLPFRNRAQRLCQNFNGDFEGLLCSANKTIVFGGSGAKQFVFNPIDNLPKKNELLWFKLLTMDLYKPVSLGKTFEFFYANEYFNPETSPKRIWNSIYRFNRQMKITGLPFQIRIENHEFQLHYTGKESCHLELTLAQFNHEKLSTQVCLKMLKLKFGRNQFNSLKASQFLKISIRGARTLIAWAKQSKILRQHYSGPLTEYSFFEV